MTNTEPPRQASRAQRLLISILAFFFPFFLCGGVASAYYFYDTVREYVAYGNLPDYGSVMLGGLAQTLNGSGTSNAPNLAAGERVNVLLLGIDKREGEVGPFRTDTMIVTTLDPKSKTAAMLSIPRDLYVPIPYPGLGENRINTANFFGELYKYPGGGPSLAKKTVEYNLGIPIHFYVLIDFNGFKKIVNTLGGIDIDVPTPIDDPEYPTENYGTMSIHIPAGHLHMDGELALEYARSRHTTNDFDRSKRQMQILKAMRDKALKLDILPKLPQLYAQLKDAVQTDISLPQALALAPLAAQVRSEDIKSRAIDQSMTYEIRLNNGADVLWPERSKIAQLVNELFPANAESEGGVTQENSRVAVLNGNGKPGTAQQAAAYLKDHGYNVVQVGNADRSDYRQSVILSTGEAPNTVSSLARQFRVLPNNIRKFASAPAGVDVQVIIGADWALPSE